MTDHPQEALPELPEPAARVDFHISAEFDLVIGTNLHTTDQLRAYAEAAVARERERCADLCEEMVLYTGLDCAQAIRKGP